LAQSVNIVGDWSYKTFYGIEKIDPTTRIRMNEDIWKSMKLTLKEDGTYKARFFGNLSTGEYKTSGNKIVFKDVNGKHEHQIISLTAEELVMQFNDKGLIVVLKRTN
jgi:hypothetical protein